jgi:hypothetical protein
VNGTHQGTPVANQAVTLQATGGDGTHDLATATTDGQGHFNFQNVPGAASAVLGVYTHFQQGLFSTPPLNPDDAATRNVTLTVYDATASDAALRITSATALVHDLRPANGLIGVGEFFTFHNSGNTAFVGSRVKGSPARRRSKCPPASARRPRSRQVTRCSPSPSTRPIGARSVDSRSRPNIPPIK